MIYRYYVDTLMELVQRAEFLAEDWGEFRLIIALEGHGANSNLQAEFDIDEGTLTLTEAEPGALNEE